MNIEEARKARGMSRKDVSRKLGIPYRSLENWEKGLSKCPDYVERLVVAEILRGGKKMTDIEVLMKNGYSKRKAEEELKRGTVVFEGEDFERHFDDYMEEWFAEAPTHHFAMSVGHNGRLFEKVACLLGIPAVVLDRNT